MLTGNKAHFLFKEIGFDMPYDLSSFSSCKLFRLSSSFVTEILNICQGLVLRIKLLV